MADFAPNTGAAKSFAAMTGRDPQPSSKDDHIGSGQHAKSDALHGSHLDRLSGHDDLHGSHLDRLSGHDDRLSALEAKGDTDSDGDSPGSGSDPDSDGH